MYGWLQLQFKTHSVLLRLAAQGRVSRCFWPLRKAATGAASASNRATTERWPLPKIMYTRTERELAASAEDGAAGELISHSDTAGQQRLRLWVPQEINPLWGPRLTGPEQNCGDGCKIGLHPQRINSRPIAACFAPVYLLISFPDEFYQFNCR